MQLRKIHVDKLTSGGIRSPNIHLTSAQVLEYPDFSHPFKLEMDAPLQELDTVLSQRDKHGKGRVITYAN